MTTDVKKLTRVAKAAVKYRAAARNLNHPNGHVNWATFDAAVDELDAAIAALME